MIRRTATRFFLCSTALVLTGAVKLRADDTNLEQEVRELRAENAILKKQVQQQDGRLDQLAQKVGELETNGVAHGNEAAEDSDVPTQSGMNFGKVNLSGEGGVAFFNTGS